MDLSLLPDGGMRWLDASGPKSTIVLSTRIRLARNVRGIPFSQRAKDGDRTAVFERVSEAAAASDHLASAVAFRLDQMERPERQLLHERHLVSKELAGLERESRPRPGAALLVQDQVGVMVNEEDHLRLHGMWLSYVLSDECGNGAPGQRTYPFAGPCFDQGNQQSSARSHAGGIDLSGLVRGRQRSRREFLPVVQPNNLGEDRRRADRPPREDRAPGGGIRGTGTGRPVADGAG